MIFPSSTPAKVVIYQNLHSSDLAGSLTYQRHTATQVNKEAKIVASIQVIDKMAMFITRAGRKRVME